MKFSRTLTGILPLVVLTLISCARTKFNGESENPPQCVEEAKDALGAHIAFVIDNSGSNGSDAETDCPGMQRANGYYYCSQPTMREISVLESVEFLDAMTKAEPTNAQAESILTLISYNDTRANTHLSNVSTRNGALAPFTNAVQFARRPYGDTPLLRGLQNGYQALQNSLSTNDPRAKVMIIVSDGYNTDRQLNPIYSISQQFRAAGGKIFAITNTDGKNKAERDQYFHNYMKQRPNWSSEYTNQEYVARVVGENGHQPILKEISDAYFEVDNANDIPKVMKKIVVEGAVSCK